MSFSFQPHIHHLVMHNQIILLDEKKDHFMILSESQTTLLTENSKSCAQYENLLNELTQLNLIHRTPYSQALNRVDEEYEGIDNYTWRISRCSSSSSLSLLPTIWALLDLLRLKISLKKHGLGYVLNSMRKAKINKKNGSTLSQEALKNYVNSVHHASLLLPLKVKCLESSICIFNYAIKNGENCNFFIGVQLFDFLSHAWVEIDEKVVSDDQHLSSKLPKILSI
ncbi:hypothetical protein HNP29_004100 [Pseudomonas alcaligenes]|nr:hypothetical protein [Pseudomonas alcaligenes]